MVVRHQQKLPSVAYVVSVERNSAMIVTLILVLNATKEQWHKLEIQVAKAALLVCINQIKVKEDANHAWPVHGVT
jgi:hypothetical protein